jgi:hypothetical protein
VYSVIILYQVDQVYCTVIPAVLQEHQCSAAQLHLQLVQRQPGQLQPTCRALLHLHQLVQLKRAKIIIYIEVCRMSFHQTPELCRGGHLGGFKAVDILH